jgi:uncharacterized protein (DUF2062 family)
MLFRRRLPESFTSKIRNWMWPKQGWWRTLKYYKFRAVRIDDSSYSIAAGLAFGCAISFTPAFGTHIIQSAIFCLLVRANWLAAVIGTIFGNPVTFPFLWSISTFVGLSLFKLFGFGDFLEGFYFPTHVNELGDLPVKFLLPVMVGGYVTGLVAYPVFYYSFRSMIRAAREARKKRMTQKAHQVAKEVTGQED